MFKDRLRIKILLWLSVIMLVAYIDRVNFAMSAPIILKEFGMNAGQLGIIFSAFTLGYTLMNFPGGFLVEKFSVRVMLTIIIILWSFFVGLTALAWSFTSLLVIRIAFGAFEGPMIPGLTKTVINPANRHMNFVTRHRRPCDA